MGLKAQSCLTWCALVFGSALTSAQRASAPSPGGSLASAPAPGTPGDYTLTSGPYIYIFSPNVSTESFSTSAYAYSSRSNGSVATDPCLAPCNKPIIQLMLGLTEAYTSQDALITRQIANPPSPVNTTLQAQQTLLTDAFGGAACISYSFSSNASAVIVGIADADQLFDGNYPKIPARFPYTICGATNCTSGNTYALNASAGHYYFNISNPSSSPASVALSYVLFPANASACQGLSSAGQVPTPYTQTTSAIVIPPLRSSAVIYGDYLPDNGYVALVGSVRNTSCVTALLSLNSTYQSGRIPLPSPATLLLLDQRGLEDLLNPDVLRLTPAGGCQAGSTTTNCAFTTPGLVQGQAYHLWVYYEGNSSASGFDYDAFLAVTFATNSSAGNCSNLISTNATNGGFRGSITFPTTSSSFSDTIVTSTSLRSPSFPPSPPAPDLGNTGSGRERTLGRSSTALDRPTARPIVARPVG